MVREVEIAVIGAGVIGLAIAHRLAVTGREVVVFDPAPPGSGASYGNAGAVADYAVQPVGTPDVLRNLPALLFDRNSPLAIRRAALPTLAPWLLRFARQSLPAAARRNAAILAGLLADAAPRWQDLAAEIGGAAILQDRGCAYWYQTDQALKGAKADLGFRRQFGVTVELLSAAELAALEPGLPITEGGGAYFPKVLWMRDPGAMVALLAEACARAGVRFETALVSGLERDRAGVRLSGPGIIAKRVVIAAGAHSKGLARAAGDRVPLDTERGYHLEWDMPVPRLNRPICPTTRGFYLCPMDGRLRAAGTVELGGLSAPPSPHRLKKLGEGVHAVFPDLGAPSRSWMGFRPSMPDSLPVVGPSRGGGDIIHAYGHGHIGLTLAPITSELVAALVAGKTDHPLLHGIGPTRF
ncbi:MAG: FAD-dependent oxidoreductase [Albidovulum sp.]